MKKLWIALLLCLLLPAARAEEAPIFLTYDELPAEYRAFFDAAEYADAQFYVDAEYDRWQEYYRESGYRQMTHSPILSLRGEAVRVHLFDVSDGVSLIAESQTPMALPAGYALHRPIYHTNGVYADTDWDYDYRETLNIYFYSADDPCWVMQLVFENFDPDDAAAFALSSCGMQFEPARAVGGQPYDSLTYSFYGDGMLVAYSYLEGEGGHVEFTLPLAVSRDLWTYDPAALPKDPLALFAPSRVETARHGNGGRLILRAAPDRGGKVVARLENGAALRYVDLADGWALVLYRDQLGYARAEYIEGSGGY